MSWANGHRLCKNNRQQKEIGGGNKPTSGFSPRSTQRIQLLRHSKWPPPQEEKRVTTQDTAQDMNTPARTNVRVASRGCTFCLPPCSQAIESKGGIGPPGPHLPPARPNVRENLRPALRLHPPSSPSMRMVLQLLTRKELGMLSGEKVVYQVRSNAGGYQSDMYLQALISYLRPVLEALLVAAEAGLDATASTHRLEGEDTPCEPDGNPPTYV